MSALEPKTTATNPASEPSGALGAHDNELLSVGAPVGAEDTGNKLFIQPWGLLGAQNTGNNS